jgi:hypothetical protein
MDEACQKKFEGFYCLFRTISQPVEQATPKSDPTGSL